MLKVESMENVAFNLDFNRQTHICSINLGLLKCKCTIGILKKLISQ